MDGRGEGRSGRDRRRSAEGGQSARRPVVAGVVLSAARLPAGTGRARRAAGIPVARSVGSGVRRASGAADGGVPDDDHPLRGVGGRHVGRRVAGTLASARTTARNAPNPWGSTIASR